MAQSRPSSKASPARPARRLTEVATTRSRHLANLVANPNYYGTELGSKLTPVFPLADHTAWEELRCVGFNPRLAQIEAVVVLKLPTGYQGDLCSLGSTEYVRFFIDWHDGAGFQDIGLASFKAHDIPEGKLPNHPLDYLVTLTLSAADRERCCRTPVLPTVRAILDWNHVPPSDPNYHPPFGNARDANIQIVPGVCRLKDLFDDVAIDLEKLQLAGVDISASLPPLAQKAVPWSELLEEYRKNDVPDHRLVYEAVYPLVAGGTDNALAAAQPDIANSATLGIDLNQVVVTLGDGQGNTSYEQLTCVGLNSATDTLGAVINIKRPYGYNGNLCRAGSQEYVAFWADWDRDGVFESYLGTTAINVHDIYPLPGGGLYYSVSLPVNVSEHLQSCETPNIVPIRGVLSWAVPPSTTNPNDLKYWGNRLDVLVQIRPGEPTTGLYDLLYDVGNVAISDISTTTFLAQPSTGALGACGHVGDRPFSGNTRIGGRIYNSGAPGSVDYQVQYAPHGSGAWQPVSTANLLLEMMHPNPSDLHYPKQNITISATGGYYPYSEDWSASPPILERTAHLADWNVSGLTDGAYDVRIEYTVDHITFFHSVVVTVIVNNTSFEVSPTANATVDTAYTVDLVIDGGDCHTYASGAIDGHLRAVHPYFGGWSLHLEPTSHTHGAQAMFGTPAVPACRSYMWLSDSGDGSMAWTLDTGLLDPCGYTLTLTAYDRRIVNSSPGSTPKAYKAVGFSKV